MANQVSCAGINIGYGHVKLATPAGVFLSASACAPSNPLYDGIGRGRDTHKTTVQGVEYEVGAEAILLTRTPETARLPVPQWLDTTRYRVLAQLVWDRLALEGDRWAVVIGLPIADYRDAAYRGSVREAWKGQHPTANGPITITEARVVPEPVGAVFTHLDTLAPEEMESECLGSHLVIDIGFFTTDWLVLTRMAPDLEQSHGIDIGMHAILAKMADHIAADYQKSGTSDLVTLETLLLEQIETGRVGKVDLLAYANRATDEIVPSLIDDIKSRTYRWLRTDTDKRILVAGGAASFLAPYVARAFPGIPVAVLENPQMANALGYRSQCERLSRVSGQQPATASS